MAVSRSVAAEIEDGLGKLAALGDVEHIRIYLCDEHITGVRGDSRACAIASYLAREVESAKPGSLLMVWPHCEGAPDALQDAVTYYHAGRYLAEVALPQVLNEFAVRFDRGEFPELTHLPKVIYRNVGHT